MTRQHSITFTRQPRRASWLAMAAVACSTVVVSPPVAHGAPYSVWACANSSGTQLGTGDWKPRRIGGDLQRLDSTCNTGKPPAYSSMYAAADAATINEPTSTGAGWHLDAVGGTSIKQLVVWWYHCAMGYLGPGTSPPGRIRVFAGKDVIYNVDPPPGPDWSDCFGSSSGPSPAYNEQTFSDLNAPSVALQAECLSRCNETGFTMPAADFRAYRMKVVVDDAVAPAGAVSGLADGARISAAVPLSVQATDTGSGVSELTLRVDDRVVQKIAGDGRCADVDSSTAAYDYEFIAPCPPERSTTLALHPAHLPDLGPHVVTVVATDASGQSSVLARARVALGAPTGYFGSAGFFNPDLNIVAPRAFNGLNAGPGNARLSFVVRRGKRTRHLTRRVVRLGARPQIAGRLTNAAGAPIAGARVWRFVAVTKGLWQLAGRPLTTSRTGRVRGWLPSRHSSREVRLVYFPYSDSNENVQSRDARLAVRSATTLNVDRGGYQNGETVRFSGRIISRPLNVGQAVYLQAMVRGRWRTFDTTRADPNGRWRLRYRFSATRRVTAYRFRAVIPASNIPVRWATGQSRTLRVLVTP